MLGILTNSLVPIFVGLLVGYAAGLRKLVDNRHVESLITFLMTITLPCSMFIAIAITPREMLLRQTKPGVALAIVYVVLYVAVYYASKHWNRDTPAHSAVLALTVAFPNVAAVGIPLLIAVYGPQAAVGVAVAIAVGSITITPVTLAILENGTPAGKALSQGARIRGSAWKAVKKPVFWAPMLGVVVAVASLPLPVWLNRSLTILGAAAEATALFVTGLIASAQSFKMDRAAGWVVAAKNVLQPALCLAVALLLSMPAEDTRHVVLLSAIPCGFFGVLFGQGSGSPSPAASSGLIASTVLCVFTLMGWILILNRLT
jgi:predicted permease